MFVRHGHRLRGKPPAIAKTLKQRLAGEYDCKDLKIHFKLEIKF